MTFATPLKAHSPYLDGFWTCELRGEFRITFLYGDGMLGPDPKAIVVLDVEGRIRAYQDVSTLAFPLHGENCSVFDPNSNSILTPAPEHFFDGEIIEGDRDSTRSIRWRYEPGGIDTSSLSEGFKHTPSKELSRVRTFLAEVSYHKSFSIVTVLLAGICSFLMIAAIKFRSKWFLMKLFVLCAAAVPGASRLFVLSFSVLFF